MKRVDVVVSAFAVEYVEVAPGLVFVSVPVILVVVTPACSEGRDIRGVRLGLGGGSKRAEQQRWGDCKEQSGHGGEDCCECSGQGTEAIAT